MRQNVSGVFHSINGPAAFPLTPLPVRFVDGNLILRDFDGDSRCDLVLNGLNNTVAAFVMYRQNVSLTFYNVANTASFPAGSPLGTQRGMMDIGDLDGNGRPDLFVTGFGYMA